jgi:TRAP-type C4-dicarboxylate transport system substrate-binding protein
MPSLEVYTSLQQGIIDACENPLEAHIRSKYAEAARYVIMTSHVRAFYTFIYWGKTFNSFSPELQKILKEEGEKAMQWGTDETLKRIKGFEQTLKNRGAEFVNPDVEAFRAKLKPMKNDFPELAEWIDKFDAVQ